MPSRTTRIRRFSGYLVTLTVLFYVSIIVYRYYHHEKDSSVSVPVPVAEVTPPAKPYNQFVNQDGYFLPYSGYKILQFVKKPLAQGLVDFNEFFTKQENLNTYFKPVPAGAYHVTLANLKNKTTYEAQDLQTLTDEQILLDKDETEITSTSSKLSLIRQTEIRLEIDLTNDKLEEYQERWKTKFPSLILEQYTSFYITVAYQYKPVPNQEIYTQIDDLLSTAISTAFDIPLDPIEICSYQDLVSYTPILPDAVLPAN